MKHSAGFTLVVTLMMLVVFMLLGVLILKLSQTSWQDLVLSSQRIDKIYAEKSLWNWAKAYTLQNSGCFESKNLQFNVRGASAYHFYMKCEQRAQQRLVTIESVIDPAGNTVSPYQASVLF